MTYHDYWHANRGVSILHTASRLVITVDWTLNG